MTRTIFLTGFPGFLGSALVGRLLDRHDQDVAITALVQPRYLERAEARATRIEAESPARRGRIRIVEGDIARPRLGMDPAAYDAVQREAREVWHGRESGHHLGRHGLRPNSAVS